MSAHGVTLVFYLCAMPAADARALACNMPQMLDAPTCAEAVRRVIEQTPGGRIVLPAGCEPLHRPRDTRR